MKFIRAAVLFGLAVLGGGAACGPSFQAVYECDVHFEHCYALDQSNVSVDAKKDCWRDWLHGYTYGQSRDRIEYGGTRLSQLSLDPTLPSEDVRDASTHPRHTIAAPMPTNAFAPPPNVIDGHDSSDPASTASPALRAPGADCADSCKHRWTACRGACRTAICDDCDEAYRSCMPVCFRDGSGGAPAASPLSPIER